MKPVPALPATTQASTATAAAMPRSTLLQRKCRCGSAAGVSGECAGCESERRFGTTGLQTKLKISTPGDPYEQEADRLADEVVRMPSPVAGSPRPGSADPGAIYRKVTPLIQRQAEPEEEEEATLQTKRRSDGLFLQRQEMGEEEEEEMQAKAAPGVEGHLQRQEESEEEEEQLQTRRGPGSHNGRGGQAVNGATQAQIHAKRGAGQTLPSAERAFMESRFGVNFSHIRVHADASAARLSAGVRARAFTVGHDVFFGTGAYAPGTIEGRRLLAHELVHTLQQGTARTRSTRAQSSSFETGVVQRRADGPAAETNSSIEPLPNAPQSTTAPAAFDSVEIGSPNDAHECEADRITDAVAAMGPLAPTSSAGRPAPPPGSRVTRGGGTWRPSSSSTGVLTVGGVALPRPIRDIFEPRFNRNFGHVRVHTGPLSDKLNETVQSRAFTYGSHIWMGAGEALAATVTMAHELAHVVQQSSPSPLEGQAQPAGSRPVLRRKLYWEPSDMNGTKTHEKVLPLIRNANSGNVFVEAPIPNANRKSTGAGVHFGRADLKKVIGQGERALGVQFDGQGVPEPLPGPIKKQNKKYNHQDRSAPYSDRRDNITRASRGPSKVFIADLKPAPASPQGTRGKRQIDNYIMGIKHAHAQTNKWLEAQVKPPGRWRLSTAGSWENVKVKTPRGRDFQNRDLVVKDFTWHQDKHDSQKWKPSMTVFKPKKRIKGHLVIEKAKSNGAIIQYRWKPSYPYSKKTISSALPKLKTDPLFTNLLKDLRTLETKKVSGSFLPGARPPRTLTPVPRRVQRKTKDKPDTKVKDSFKAKDWERRREKLGNKYRGTPGADDARLQYFLAEADKDAGEPDGFHDLLTERSRKIIGKLEFWTGKRAGFLGILRQRFGRVFVKVMNLVHGFRSKLKGLLAKKSGKPPKATSYGAVAVRAILRAVSQLAGPLFRQSLNTVASSLRVGVERQLKAVFPIDEPAKLFEELIKDEADRFPQIAALKQAGDTIRGKVDAFKTELEAKFGPLFDFLESLINKAKSFGKIIKVAMVAIQCATPPLLGCLKLVASRAIAKLSDKVLSWCYIQEKFQNTALGFDAVKNLPKTLAIKFVALLPDDPIVTLGGKRLSVQSFFDQTVLATAKQAAKVKPDCKPKEMNEPDSHHEAVADLMEELGCDHDPKSQPCLKLAALGELAGRHGVYARRLTPDEIRTLGPYLKKQGFTAEDLKAAASASGRSKKMKLEDFLKEAPQWAKTGRAKQSFRAKKQVGAIGAGLGEGDVVYAADLNWKTLKRTGSLTDVAFAQGISKGNVAFGILNFHDAGKFDCRSRGRITFEITPRKVRLADSEGNQVPTSLEGRPTTVRLTGSPKSADFKKAFKGLCKNTPSE